MKTFKLPVASEDDFKNKLADLNKYYETGYQLKGFEKDGEKNVAVITVPDEHVRELFTLGFSLGVAQKLKNS